MENAQGLASSGHGESLSKTEGILTMSYTVKDATLRCKFDGKEISVKQLPTPGRYALTLRSGVHEITSGGDEKPGKGSFTTTFDNLKFTA